MQPAFSAPGGNGKGNAKGHDKFEQPKGNKNHEAKGQIKNKGLKRGHAIDHAKKQSTEAASSPEPQIPAAGNKHNLETEMQFTLKNLHGVLNKLQNSKWWYNPHPESQGGNMGKPEKLDPYGHDKDSNRMELYGNRGRVIKTPIVEPEPEPELPPPEPEPELPPPPEPEPEPVPPPPPPEPEPEPELPPFTLGG